MLYLGQVCKWKKAFTEGGFFPGIFLGFTKVPRGARVLCQNEDGSLEERDINLSDIGFVREPYKDSPTGMRIFHGEFCKDIVDEHITLKRPSDHQTKDILSKAVKLMKENAG